MTDAQSALLATLATEREIAAGSPSPFYATLLEHMAADVRAGGPTWDLLERYADEPTTEWYGFRALSGVHYEVLAGERPGLAAHYPSTGGDGDAGAAWPGVRDAFAGHDPEILADLRHPLQTNETSRCGALVGGFCAVARATGMPLRLRELGASAGLNLHFDRYRYELGGGAALGPASSPIRFVDYWDGGAPDLGAAVRVSSRAGCDLDPIDPTTDHGRLTLESYLWPDEAERFRTLRAAIAIVRELPVRVDAASADAWVERELAQPAEGEATVVYHSVFWDYVPDDVRARIRQAIEGAGARASATAPLAWLRYESGGDPGVVEVRLRTWPGGEDHLLGTGRYHWHPVRWLTP
jgi:hypothetical protein